MLKMETFNVQIKNCNNILEGNIKLLKNYLNIKFAANGTGKSTIAKAILNSSKHRDLSELKSYGVNENPNISLDTIIENVFVFNDDFVNDIVFDKSEVIKNSFEVFIKSPEYERRLNELNTQLKDLKIDLGNNEELNSILLKVNEITTKIKFNNNGEVTNNPFVKSLISEQHIFKVPETLSKFKDFFETDYSVDWIDWKNKGYSYDEKGTCPFCTEKHKKDYAVEKQAFTSSYSKSNAKNMKDMLSFFESLKNYISDEKYIILSDCIKSSSDEILIKSTLKKFVTELNYFRDKILQITQFDSYKIKSEEISQLSTKLSNLKIDENAFDIFTKDEIFRILKPINERIDLIINEVGELKRKVGALKGLIQASADKAISDINGFLESAGINYELYLDVTSQNDSKTILKYVDPRKQNYEVDIIKQHLSWGEKNAFALVLFMHYALSADADLIVLDDPISSFDSDKKYAIINRLFRNRSDRTFYNKTVVMFTHDIEPVIDFIINKKPTGGKIHADYLINKDGNLIETEIKDEDIQSQTQMLMGIAKDSRNNILNRLIALRKYIEHTKQTEDDGLAYNILSCLVHNKAIPDKKISETSFIPLTLDEIQRGTDLIKNNWIDNFSYENILHTDMKEDALVNLYNSEPCKYFKLQIFRVILEVGNKRAIIQDDVLLKHIDETYHIENDFLYNLDCKKFEIVPEFIIKKCDEFMRRHYLMELV